MKPRPRNRRSPKTAAIEAVLAAEPRLTAGQVVMRLGEHVPPVRVTPQMVCKVRRAFAASRPGSCRG
jgi:phage tail protein X